MRPNPNPDPTLSWQDDAWIPGTEELRAHSDIRQEDYEDTLVQEKLLEARAQANHMAELIYEQKRSGIERG